MIVTIGGPPGSGKTTIAKMISEKFGLEHIYAGKIFREMAAEKKMTLEEFSEYSEKNKNIDFEVDERQKKMAKDGTIVEGRMSAFLIPADLKIFLNAPFDVRVKRIAERENLPYQEVYKNTLERERSEKKRYKNYYGVDIYDISHYDLVINTENWSIEGVFKIVEKAITCLQR